MAGTGETPQHCKVWRCADGARLLLCVAMLCARRDLVKNIAWGGVVPV